MQDRDGWEKGVRAWWRSAWILGSNMRIEVTPMAASSVAGDDGDCR